MLSKFVPMSFKRFKRDEDGLVSVEFAIYAPLVLLIFAVIFTFFEAFRQESVNLKATYTVSDLISRETRELNEEYMDSMHKMAGLLVRPGSDLSLRVTIVRWDAEEERYFVDWSKVRGDRYLERDDGSLTSVAARLPTLPDQERVILVETYNVVQPPFPTVFLELRDERFDQSREDMQAASMFHISNFVFTRPRFAPLVRFEGIITPGPAHNDGPDPESS